MYFLGYDKLIPKQTFYFMWKKSVSRLQVNNWKLMNRTWNSKTEAGKAKGATQFIISWHEKAVCSLPRYNGIFCAGYVTVFITLLPTFEFAEPPSSGANCCRFIPAAYPEICFSGLSWILPRKKDTSISREQFSSNVHLLSKKEFREIRDGLQI